MPAKAAALTDSTSANANAKATVEQTYQKLTQHQHILQRPDTYVGSIESVTTDMYVYDQEAATMKLRKLSYVPGLYKTFDEILVNAADNKQRDGTMDEIRVDIDRETSRISVQAQHARAGLGPTRAPARARQRIASSHPHQLTPARPRRTTAAASRSSCTRSTTCTCRSSSSARRPPAARRCRARTPRRRRPRLPLPSPPSVLPGHLLTSSNYNDNQKKVTGGRNGYGAKLTNIFSSEFIVETVDSEQGKKFKQVRLERARRRPMAAPAAAATRHRRATAATAAAITAPPPPRCSATT